MRENQRNTMSSFRRTFICIFSYTHITQTHISITTITLSLLFRLFSVCLYFYAFVLCFWRHHRCCSFAVLRPFRTIQQLHTNVVFYSHTHIRIYIHVHSLTVDFVDCYFWHFSLYSFLFKICSITIEKTTHARLHQHTWSDISLL